MSVHFYRMATMGHIGCGRPAVDGTDFTWNIDEVTCGNCKRSKAFKAAVAAREATATNLRDLADYWRSRTDAVSEWRNGPRVIEYATTEEAYDAAMSDDTITNGTVLMVRAEGVIGVLMNAWPVAVTAANGQFHHTINPLASGTDPSWDKAVSLAVALGFPLQFAERPTLMDRIRSLGTVAADAEDSAPFRTRSKVKNTRQARRFRKGA